MVKNVKSYQSIIDSAKSASVYFDPSTRARKASKPVQPASESKFELVKESLGSIERGHGRKASKQAEVPMPSLFRKRV